MLLAIDEAKVKESLAMADMPSYVVTASHLGITQLPPVPPPPSSIGGTMFGMPRVSPGTREYVMSLRRKIEESGVPLKTADELDKEVGDMRGRSR